MPSASLGNDTESKERPSGNGTSNSDCRRLRLSVGLSEDCASAKRMRCTSTEIDCYIPSRVPLSFSAPFALSRTNSFRAFRAFCNDESCREVRRSAWPLCRKCRSEHGQSPSRFKCSEKTNAHHCSTLTWRLHYAEADAEAVDGLQIS